MNFTLSLTKLYPSFILGMLAVSFFSCGSYQQASYYDDGIYSSRNRVVVVEKRNTEAERIQEAEGNLYSDYFGQRASEYGEILDSEVFTDIDGYNNAVSDDSELREQENYFANNNNYNGNAGWGDNPSNIAINVYDNGWGWNNWGWGGFGWGWNNWGWNNWGWGGFGWGWNNPWRWNRWGWNRWGWGGIGWGWNNWGWAGYGGWGWNGGFYNRNIAFNRSRRSYLNSGLARNNLRGRSNLSRSVRNRSYVSNGRSIVDRRTSLAGRSYRSNGTTRRSIGTDAFARNQSYRSSRSSRSTPRYSGITRSNPTRYNGSTRSSSSARTGTATRSSGTYNRSGQSTHGYRSSTRTLPRSSSYGQSSSRSSGYRSSTGSSRSSGSFSSSSSRSSGSFGRSSGGGRSFSGGRSSGGRSGGRRN